jgi:hypothetical protein
MLHLSVGVEVRRACKCHVEKYALAYAPCRLEVLRLKRGFIEPRDMEEVRNLASKYPQVVCAGWWPLNFTGRHDNAFLSFLQKLSVLRCQENIIYPKNLAEIKDDYDKCPRCQEAYKIMTSKGEPWSESIKPWITHMPEKRLTDYQTHEYAHWFGHILSAALHSAPIIPSP